MNESTNGHEPASLFTTLPRLGVTITTSSEHVNERPVSKLRKFALLAFGEGLAVWVCRSKWRKPKKNMQVQVEE